MTYMATHTCQSESSNARLEEHHGTLQGDSAEWAEQGCPALRIVFVTRTNVSISGINGTQLPELRLVMLDVFGLEPRQPVKPRFTMDVSATSSDVVWRNIA